MMTNIKTRLACCVSMLREYAEGRRRSDAYSNKKAKPPTVVGE